MKFTEGGFRDWGYQLAKDEFGASELDGGAMVYSYKSKNWQCNHNQGCYCRRNASANNSKAFRIWSLNNYESQWRLHL